jgi:hypothetical protein
MQILPGHHVSLSAYRPTERTLRSAFVVVITPGLIDLLRFGQFRQISESDRRQSDGKLAETMEHQRVVRAFGGIQPLQGLL